MCWGIYIVTWGKGGESEVRVEKTVRVCMCVGGGGTKKHEKEEGVYGRKRAGGKQLKRKIRN